MTKVEDGTIISIPGYVGELDENDAAFIVGGISLGARRIEVKETALGERIVRREVSIMGIYNFFREIVG